MAGDNSHKGSSIIHAKCLHGLRRSIVSDRGFYLCWSQSTGTVLAMSTAYHPETDGQTEIINKGVVHYPRCFAGEHSKQ